MLGGGYILHTLLCSTLLCLTLLYSALLFSTLLHSALLFSPPEAIRYLPTLYMGISTSSRVPAVPTRDSWYPYSYPYPCPYHSHPAHTHTPTTPITPAPAPASREGPCLACIPTLRTKKKRDIPPTYSDSPTFLVPPPPVGYRGGWTKTRCRHSPFHL